MSETKTATSPATLTEFLWRRLAAEEQAWKLGQASLSRPWFDEMCAMACDEIEVKRAILRDYERAIEQSKPSGKPTLWGKEARFGLGVAVQHMAGPYRKHSEFREEWL